MFQYTTETIINSNKGNLPGGKRFGVIGAGDAALQTSATADDFLVVDGVNSFKIEYIKKIYKAAYRASKKAKAELTLGTTNLSAGEIVRLTIAISERGSVRSTIQNAYLHKNKPFHYELEVPAAGSSSIEEELVKALVKLIKKDMAMTDFAYFKAAVDGSNAKKLVLEADDCYIQFDSVKLEKVLEIEDDNTPLASKLLGYNVVAGISGLTLNIEAGDEGQGTVARLVKNLRIPTGASINPFGADQGGKPVPGGEYTQFLIEYETPRAHVSGTVMGSVGEVSRTSHVFFIESKALKEWNDVLGYVTGATGAVATAIIPSGRPAAGESRTAGTGDAVDTISTDASGVVTLTEKDPHIGSVE